MFVKNGFSAPDIFYDIELNPREEDVEVIEIPKQESLTQR